jgi:hypothetical protein
MLLLLSSVFIVGVLAQDTNREEHPNGHGIVVDSVTEKPLHALVYIVAPDRDIVITAETGEDGIFKLHLPPGGYVWEAEAEHHHPGRGEFRVGDKYWEVKIVLEPLEVHEEPEIPDHNVGGMLINAKTGEGVPGHIGFINPDGKAIEMETEEDGEFRVLLFPGPWMWKAGARGFEVQEGRFLMEREPVRLMIEMVPLNNEEPEKRGAMLYGHVITPEGKPIPGALIYIHPMMREEEPPVRPGMTEDPPEEPKYPDRDPNTRQSEREEYPDREERPEGENVEDRSISFREFLARFSEKIDKEILERVFKTADADGDGVLNGREMMRALAILEEWVGENVREPERERPKTKTDEKGMFKVGLPFGEYVITAEAKGFHPNRVPVRISPRMDKYEVKIVLEPMREPHREPRDCGRMKIAFNMEDHNSDGNPEIVKFAADLNGDGVHEIVYHMVDRNSDGNPESVEWVLDIPMEMWQKVMGIIMKLVEGYETYENMEWGQWGEIKEGWEGYEGEEDHPMDLEYIMDLIAKKTDKDPDMAHADDKDPSLTDKAGNKDTDDLDNGEMDKNGISDKASSNKEDTPVLEILAAIGVLSFILAILIGFGVYIRKTRN